MFQIQGYLSLGAMKKFSKIEESLWGLVNEAKKRKKKKAKKSITQKIIQTPRINKPGGSIFFMDFGVS